MKAQVLTGSKKEIADTVMRISGEVREAIVFVEEPTERGEQAFGEDLFAGMEPYSVKAGGADYSREAVYSRIESE